MKSKRNTNVSLSYAVIQLLGVVVGIIILIPILGYMRMSDAKDNFISLRQAQDGVKAEALAKKIAESNPVFKKYDDKWLKIVGVANKDELKRFVQEAYWKQGLASIKELKDLKSNPLQAEKLRATILNCQEKSNEPIGNFSTSLFEINRYVMLNKLRDAARDGTLTVADLVATGIIMPSKTYPAKKTMPTRKVTKKTAMAKKTLVASAKK
jgi:hypothetical protein